MSAISLFVTVNKQVNKVEREERGERQREVGPREREREGRWEEREREGVGPIYTQTHPLN